METIPKIEKTYNKMQNVLSKSKLDILYSEVVKAGLWAEEMQSKVTRSYKADGSVLTEVDSAISKRLIAAITELFPDCKIISEEDDTPDKIDAPFTFVLDPIDGTDVYSQGLPSFAVSLGILDKDRTPVGAMISAPRFGIAAKSLDVRLDPGSAVLVNDKEFKMTGNKNHLSQIAMSSKGQNLFDYSDFHAKARIFGSTIIHLLLPVLLPSFQACSSTPCYIWDVASSHAVMKYFGMDIEYVDGTPFLYDDYLYSRNKMKNYIIAGTKEAREEMKRTLPLKD